jgi:hypothetical protein
MDDMDAAKSGTKPYRLGAFIDGHGWVEHKYGRVWQRKEDRLVAAPDDAQVELILKLAADLQEPFRVLYVLLVPRDDSQDEGRFELMEPLTRNELTSFARRYRELFENDGRHHLWVASAHDDATIVYDQHNVLYLYGPLTRFEKVLLDEGLSEGEVIFPSPHSHHYHEELDPLVDDMLERYEWQWYPLDTRSD